MAEPVNRPRTWTGRESSQVLFEDSAPNVIKEEKKKMRATVHGAGAQERLRRSQNEIVISRRQAKEGASSSRSPTRRERATVDLDELEEAFTRVVSMPSKLEHRAGKPTPLLLEGYLEPIRAKDKDKGRERSSGKTPKEGDGEAGKQVAKREHHSKSEKVSVMKFILDSTGFLLVKVPWKQIPADPLLLSKTRLLGSSNVDDMCRGCKACRGGGTRRGVLLFDAQFVYLTVQIPLDDKTKSVLSASEIVPSQLIPSSGVEKWPNVRSSCSSVLRGLGITVTLPEKYSEVMMIMVVVVVVVMMMIELAIRMIEIMMSGKRAG